MGVVGQQRAGEKENLQSKKKNNFLQLYLRYR